MDKQALKWVALFWVGFILTMGFVGLCIQVMNRFGSIAGWLLYCIPTFSFCSWLIYKLVKD